MHGRSRETTQVTALCLLLVATAFIFGCEDFCPPFAQCFSFTDIDECHYDESVVDAEEHTALGNSWAGFLTAIGMSDGPVLYADGTTTFMEVEVIANGAATLFVQSETHPMDKECVRGALNGTATFRFVTDDGRFDETIEQNVRLWDGDGFTYRPDVEPDETIDDLGIPLDDLNGSFTWSDLTESYEDASYVGVSIGCDLAWKGEEKPAVAGAIVVSGVKFNGNTGSSVGPDTVASW